MKKEQQVIVLGMHASGTSLVSHMLIEMGINMGSDFMGPVRGVPTWEDKDFVRLNAKILAQAGGDWQRPPGMGRILDVGKRPDIQAEIEKVIAVRSGQWGFKDPRTCLTLPAYIRYFTNPLYIRVVRNPRETAQSLLKRGPSRYDVLKWIDIVYQYNFYVDAFLERLGMHRVMRVFFERLLNQSDAIEEVSRIASSVGGSIEKALSVIVFHKYGFLKSG